MQFKNNKTIEMQCGHKNQVGRVDLHELIQSANNKGLFVNVGRLQCIQIQYRVLYHYKLIIGAFLVCSSIQNCSCKLMCAVLNQSLCSSKNNLNHHYVICTKKHESFSFSACALISSADIQPYTETPSD